MIDSINNELAESMISPLESNKELSIGDLKDGYNPKFKEILNLENIEIPISIQEKLESATRILNNSKDLGSVRNPFSEDNTLFLNEIIQIHPDLLKQHPDLMDRAASVIAATIIDGKSPLESIGISIENGGVQQNLSNFEIVEIKKLKDISCNTLELFEDYFGKDLIDKSKKELSQKINDLYELDKEILRTAQENLVEFQNSIGSIGGIREEFPDKFFGFVENIFERGGIQTRAQLDKLIEVIETAFGFASNIVQLDFLRTNIGKDSQLPTLITMSDRLENLLNKYADKIYEDGINPSPDLAQLTKEDIDSLMNFNFL